jgi:hypothetical protein
MYSMHLSFFPTIQLPEQTNLPNPVSSDKREGGTLLLRAIVGVVPAGPVGQRTTAATDQLSCKMKKTGGQTEAQPRGKE